MAYSKEGLFLSESKCIIDLLKDIGTLGSKPTTTTIDKDHRLSERKKGMIQLKKEAIRGWLTS